MANRVCKQCGTPLASNETFCGNCGSRYIESSSEGLTQLSQPYSVEAQPGQRVIEPTQPALPPSSSHSSSPYDNTLYGPPNTAYGSSKYAPPPPGYNMPPTQQERYTPPPPPSYNTPPTQQQKRSSVRTILLGVIALVIIVAAAGGFFVVHTNQAAQQNANATAMARTLANNRATATVHAQAQATLNANATATALVTSHFPPFTTVAFTDPLTSSSDSQWSTGSSCKASSTGYQVSNARANDIHWCPQLSSTFNDFAFQVNMTIQSGDCGGLIFRLVDSNNFYVVLVCSDGTYDLGRIQNGNFTWYYNLSRSRTNSAIHKGTGQQNVIAIVVQSNTFNLYVNDLTKVILTVTDNAFSQGSIALVADDLPNPTSVVYTNTVVWTQ